MDSKGSLVLSVVLTVLVMGLVGYMIYDKVAKPEVKCNVGETTKEGENKNVADNNEVTKCPECNCSNKEYTMGNASSLYDWKDSKEVSAKKIAEGVAKAINNKDYYFLGKSAGADADDVIKYGISNYKVSDNATISPNDSNAYVFSVSYDVAPDKKAAFDNDALGNMLVISFKEGGRLEISLFATAA